MRHDERGRCPAAAARPRELRHDGRQDGLRRWPRSRRLRADRRVEAAATVQSVISVDAARDAVHVHLLAYAAPPQALPARNRPFVMPALLESAPVHRLRILFKDAPKAVTAAHPKTRLRQTGGVVDVEMEDVHEVITATD